MKKLLYLLALLVLCSLRAHAAGCASTSYGNYVCVSQAGSFSSGVTTRNQTISVTAGDAVTFMGQALSTASTLTLTDSGACTGPINTFGGSLTSTSSVAIAGLTKATSTGTCTITMHWAGASTTLASNVQHWTGWNGTVDASANIGSTTGTGTRSCPNIVTVQPGDLVLCQMADTGNNGGTYTAGSGFAITLGTQSMSQEAQSQVSPGSITPQFTYSQSSTFPVVTFALQAITVPPAPSFTVAAFNGSAPSGLPGGLNQWDSTFIGPTAGFFGKWNGATSAPGGFGVNSFVNLAGGTNNGAPGVTDLGTGTLGLVGTWNISQTAAGLTYSNAQLFGLTPSPLLAVSTLVNQSGPFSMHCTSGTNAGGTAAQCGYVQMSLPSPSSSNSAGIWFTTPNCNGVGTQDCGAMGMLTNGTDYINIHLNPIAGSANCSENGLFLENQGGNSVDCIPYTNGAIYRINGQHNTGHTAVTVTFTNGSAVISGTNSLAANQAIKLTTTGTLPTNFNVQISTGTVTSGITVTGAVGTYCKLSSFNGGGSGATGIVYVKTTNSISSSGISWTSLGSGYTSAPTSATATSGTATCSGTAVISSVLATPILFVSPTGLSGTQFELAPAQGAAPIVAGSAGSGTHTATQYNLLTVCQLNGFGPNGQPILIYLGTLFGTSNTTAQTVNELQMGVTGEGPTTTGFDFYWGGEWYDNTGKISLTECF